MGEAWNKKRSNRGYTLAEMVVVVAIVAILCAIAIPALVAFGGQLQLMRADNCAKQIYVTAQNRMTALDANGGISEVIDDASCQPVPDYVGDSEGGRRSLVYLVSGTSAADLLLPSGALEPQLESGTYVIEFDPLSASVYGVFFSKEDFSSQYEGGTPDSVYTDRGKELRGGHEPLLGYYGGSAAQRDPAGLLRPKVGIVNEEELLVEVACPLPKGFSDRNEFYSKLNYSITLKDPLNPAAVVAFDVQNPMGLERGTETGTRNYSFTSATGTLNLVLDSLNEDMDFASLYGNTFRPGCDLEVQVRVSYTGSQGVLLPGEAGGETNSLFQSMELINAEEDTAKYTAQVAWGRHLQNLTLWEKGEEEDNLLVEAHQTEPIDWRQTGRYYEETYRGRPQGEIRNALWFRPIVNADLEVYDGNYLPISYLLIATDKNANETEAALPYRDYVGLFAAFGGTGGKDSALRNILLENPKVTGLSTYTGALAGVCYARTVENCSVYLTEPQDSYEYGLFAGERAGGLFGSLQPQIGGWKVENCFASLPRISMTGQARSYVIGGLVGMVEGTGQGSITKSYANTGEMSIENRLSSGDRLGGLLGAVNGSLSVSDCYAIASTDMENGTVAGFANSLGNGTLKAERCYASLTLGTTAQSALAKGSLQAFGFAAQGNGVQVNECWYLSYELPPDRPEEAGESMNYRQLRTCLTGGAWGKAGPSTTFPYSAELQKKSYPFPRLSGLMHYGDWPMEKEIVAGGFLYYERYADGTIGIYGYLADGANIVKSLDDGKAVVQDGYGIVPLDAQGSLTIKIDGTEVGLSAGPQFTLDQEGRTYVLYPIPYEYVQEKPVLSHGLSKVEYGTSVWYYNPHFAKTVTYPKVGYEDAPEPPEIWSLRTVRHLAALGEYANYWSGNSFQQERDVDYASYAKFYEDGGGQSTALDLQAGQKQIGTLYGPEGKAIPFTGSYDGGGYRISAIRVPSGNGGDGAPGSALGLFAQVGGGTGMRGSVTNVNLYPASAAPSSSGGLLAARTGSAGRLESCSVRGDNKVSLTVGKESGSFTVSGMVGENSGSVENCRVEGLTLLAAGTGAGKSVCGFAGTNASGGVITGSAVVPAKDAETPMSYGAMKLTGTNAYGFVGTNRGYIKSCQVSALVEGMAFSGEASGFVGLNVSTVHDGEKDGTIEHCYSNSLVYGHQRSAGFVINQQAYLQIRNCYVAGEVGATGESGSAGGFGYRVTESGTVLENCYSLAKVTTPEGGSGTAAGFCTFGRQGENFKNKNCFYLKEADSKMWPYGYNETISDDSGAMGQSAQELWEKAPTLDRLIPGTWVEGTPDLEAQTLPYAMTGYYPYPRLADLEHYGDWPAPVSSVEIPAGVPEEAKTNRIGAFWYQRLDNGKFFIQMLAVNGQEWKDSTTPRLLSAAVIEAPEGWESWRRGYGMFWSASLANPDQWGPGGSYMQGNKLESVEDRSYTFDADVKWNGSQQAEEFHYWVMGAAVMSPTLRLVLLNNKGGAYNPQSWNFDYLLNPPAFSLTVNQNKKNSAMQKPPEQELGLKPEEDPELEPEQDPETELDPDRNS